MKTQIQYTCSNGHDIWSVELPAKCPVYRHGCPCKGSLKAVGPGSREANKRLQEAAS